MKRLEIDYTYLNILLIAKGLEMLRTPCTTDFIEFFLSNMKQVGYDETSGFLNFDQSLNLECTMYLSLYSIAG